MKLKDKLIREIIAVGWTTLYFAAFFCALILLKKLALAQYRIEFKGLSVALVAALIVAKVVLVLEHVPLGPWVRRRPAWVEVVIRTALYTIVAFVAMLMERAFHARHEHGFGSAIVHIFEHADMPQVYAATITLTGALLGFNIFSVLRQNVGMRELVRMFREPRKPARENENKIGQPE